LQAAIVHDFNNLLTPVISVMTELQRQHVGTQRQLARIEGAMFCAFRASALARQLLDTSGLRNIALAPVNLASLLTPVDALASLMRSVDYKVDLPECLPNALVDRGLMERALLNLAMNARDAMPSGGALTISASVARPSADDVPMLRVSVTDTGHGMAPEMIENILKNRLSTKRHGTGLGLARVRSAMERQGGELTICSALRHGTTVTVWLPIADPIEQLD
jgi:signal transduction histidine kinase